MTAKWALMVAVLAFALVADNVSARAASDSDIDYDVDIKYKYIVVLKGEGTDQVREQPGQLGSQRQVPTRDDVVDPRAFVERVIREHEEIAESFTLGHVYGSVINGFSATITDDSVLETIRSYHEVESVEPESVFSISCLSGQLGPAPPPPPPPVPSWGLDRIDQRNLPLDNLNPPDYKGDGAGVHIYVIDSGTSKTHNEFSGRFNPQGFDEFGGPGTVGTDCNGHGTHVAGTAAGATYGVAKKATIHSVRVLNCVGSGSTSGVLNGMNWVAQNAIQPAVVTMSLGGSFSNALNAAVNTMTNAGIVVTVAAGNEDTDACTRSPASAQPNAITGAITVGATDRSDRRASFSNWGKCLDIFAPGVDIKSAWIGSNTATNTIDGTSMACPHAAGAAAVLRGLNPSLTPAQVEGQLITLSTKNKVVDPKGSPNRLLYIGKLTLIVVGDPIFRPEDLVL